MSAAFLFLTFVSAQVTFSSSQTGTPQYSDTGTYALKGTVVNSVTGDPIPHALVQVMSASQWSVLAGPDGSFEFHDVPATRTWVTARKPGYFNQQESGRRASRPQWVQIGPNSEPVTIKLIPEAVIYGRVEDSDGEPVEGATVQLISLEIVDGRKGSQRVQGGRTDEDGEFRIANLHPGSYYVFAGATTNPARAAMAQRGVGYPVAWYYPGAPDQQAASLVRLTAGQRMEVPFTLLVQPVFRLSGTVTGQLPGQAVSVQLLNQEQGGLPFPPRTDGTGRFEFIGVPAGNYRLHAMTQGVPGQSLAADVPLAVAGSVGNIRLALVPETAISVVVRTDFVQPPRENVGGAYTGAYAPINAPQVMVQLHSPELRDRSVFSMNTGPPDKMTVEIRNVPSGTYTADFHPNGPWYVASALCGTTDLLREPLTVTAGQQVPAMEVVLRDDTATLSGSVRRNGDDDLFSVLLLPESGSPRLTTHAGTGTFEMPGLAPGDYKVLAFDNVDGLEYMNPDAMKEYLSKAVPVTLTAGAKATVTLELIRRGE